MAIHASPGVYTQIQDFSTYVAELTSTTLGLVGKTKKGPSEPTFISSVRAFTDTYGLPGKENWSALAAISYLEYGNALWFKRLVGKDATKAEADIPTGKEYTDSVLKTEVISGVVRPKKTDGKQYIFKTDLTESPIPGTVNVEIVKVDDKYNETNPIYILDNKYGFFDTDTYTALSTKDNYINYNSGEYRFKLKESSLITKILIKYTKKIYNVPEESLTISNKKATLAFPDAYGDLSVKSLVIQTETTTLKTSYSNGTINLVSSDGTVYGVLSKNNNKYIEIEFNDTHNSAIASYQTVTYDTEEISLDGNATKSISGSINRTLNENGVFVFDCTNTTTDDKNDYLAILYDENGSFIDTSFRYKGSVQKYELLPEASKNNVGDVYNVIEAHTTEPKFEAGTNVVWVSNGTSSGWVIFTDEHKKYLDTDYRETSSGTKEVNYVDYDNKSIRIVLSELFKDRVIKIKYHSKFEKMLEVVSGKANCEMDGKCIKNEVKVFKKVTSGTTTTYTLLCSDDGEGSLIKYNSDNKKIIIGTVDYGYKNKDGELKSSVVITSELEENATYVVRYNKAMGTVVSRNYGDYDNNTVVQFYRQDPNLVGNYYGLKIWNSDTYTSQTPTEEYKEFTFGDQDATTYFGNKVTSPLVEFTIYDYTELPLFNYNITLTGGKDDALNIDVNEACNALDEFADAETFDINLLAVPDFPGDKVLIEKLINVCENVRGDCFCLIDPPKGLSVQNKVAWHNGTGIYANENAINSAYAATYSSWLRINNQFTESYEWVPPSVKMVAVYAYSDANGEIWYAPAGLNRGVLFNVLNCEDNLTVADRDLLYATDTNAINPIAKFAGDGIVAYGQKTLQRKSSALNRINVMRLLLYITKALATATKYLLFEPHDSITWQKYVLMVEPMLENIRGRRGLYAYSIKCDSTTNTLSDIDNNTMIAEIALQPTKSAERIITRFKITNTGASLEE